MDVQDPSNLDLIQRCFSDIILDVRDGDRSGQMTTRTFVRKTISLDDRTKLQVTEHILQGKIGYYHYEWIGADGKRILAWGSERHDDKTVPNPDRALSCPSGRGCTGLHDAPFADWSYRDLFSIVEFIKLNRFAELARKRP